jgi:hypothetical protein
MDISNIITKILLKEEETFNTENAKINYSNPYEILDLGLKNCPSLKTWIPDENKSIK